jgi:hypothetical protein
MELIKDFKVCSIYEYVGNDKKAEKLLEEYGSDEDYITYDLNKKYPENEYFVLTDFNEDNAGMFHIRIWKKEEGKEEYIVLLEGLTQIDLFWNLDKLFTLGEARDYIIFAERLYPRNKGFYKIMKLEGVA